MMNFGLNIVHSFVSASGASQLPIFLITDHMWDFSVVTLISMTQSWLPLDDQFEQSMWTFLPLLVQWSLCVNPLNFSCPWDWDFSKGVWDRVLETIAILLRVTT